MTLSEAGESTMSATVEHIIKLIDSLPESDRESLEQHLAERAELIWCNEAEAARRNAKKRGIDEQAIDDAIHRHRYGK
jgi:hypothetical protein